MNAVRLAPVLMFLVVAPPQTGAFCEILALRSSGRQLPPWLIVTLLIGHLSILFFPVLLLSFPWVAGGGAAQFRDHLVPPDGRRGYAGQANRFYWQSLALFLPCAAAVGALFVAIYVVPLGLRIRDAVSTGAPGAKPFLAAWHPATVALAIAFWLAAAPVVTAWALTLTSVVAGDVSLARAARRTVSFVCGRPADAARFWLFVTLVGLPGVLLQHTAFLVPVAPAPLVAIATVAAVYDAYAITLLLAVAGSPCLDLDGMP